MGIGDVESPHAICTKRNKLAVNPAEPALDKWLVGGFSPPIWKIWKSMGRIIRLSYMLWKITFMFETTKPSCLVTAAKAHEIGNHNETKTQQSYLTCFQWAIVFQWLAFIQYIIHMLRYDMIWYDIIQWLAISND